MTDSVAAALWQKVSHRLVSAHQPQWGRPHDLAVRRDFSETTLLDRLVVSPGRRIKLATDFATNWKEGRAFDKPRVTERLREGVPILRVQLALELEYLTLSNDRRADLLKDQGASGAGMSAGPARILQWRNAES